MNYSEDQTLKVTGLYLLYCKEYFNPSQCFYKIPAINYSSGQFPGALTDLSTSESCRCVLPVPLPWNGHFLLLPLAERETGMLSYRWNLFIASSMGLPKYLVIWELENIKWAQALSVSPRAGSPCVMNFEMQTKRAWEMEEGRYIPSHSSASPERPTDSFWVDIAFHAWSEELDGLDRMKWRGERAASSSRQAVWKLTEGQLHCETRYGNPGQGRQKLHLSSAEMVPQAPGELLQLTDPDRPGWDAERIGFWAKTSGQWQLQKAAKKAVTCIMGNSRTRPKR